MKNKLLLSTALVSGLAFTGIANAQTSITGNLDLSYKSIGNEGVRTNSTNKGNQNDSTFGRESQINIQNKGKLSNGIDYAAGFSLEFDGVSNGQNTVNGTAEAGSANTSTITRIANENVFIDLIFGTTTLSVGADHLNNMSFSAAPRVAQHMGTTLGGALIDVDSKGFTTAQAAGVGGGVAYRFYAGVASSLGASGSMGLGIQQATPVGTVTAQYFPKTGVVGGNDQIARNTAKSAYELHYRGDLGVKGLTATLGYNNIAGNAATGAAGENDQKGKAIGVGYNFGQISAGVHRNYFDNGGTGTAKVDTKSDEIGVTFAATKALSIGLTHVETSGKYFTAADMPTKEKASSVSIGYNLGAINTSLTYSELSDARGIAGDDAKIALARAGVKF
ncbi:Porin domain, Gram-negative type [Candidatus Pelagibacterales bacterium]